MQSLASEMDLPETAFLHPEGDGMRLWWFTPAAEVELCGHATLASAHVLWETGRAGAGDTLRFATLSGELRARRDGHWIVSTSRQTRPTSRRRPTLWSRRWAGVPRGAAAAASTGWSCSTTPPPSPPCAPTWRASPA